MKKTTKKKIKSEWYKKHRKELRAYESTPTFHAYRSIRDLLRKHGQKIYAIDPKIHGTLEQIKFDLFLALKDIKSKDLIPVR